MSKVKVIQNNKIDREVKIPILNLKKVVAGSVGNSDQEFYMCKNPQILQTLHNNNFFDSNINYDIQGLDGP